MARASTAAFWIFAIFSIVSADVMKNSDQKNSESGGMNNFYCSGGKARKFPHLYSLKYYIECDAANNLFVKRCPTDTYFDKHSSSCVPVVSTFWPQAWWFEVAAY